MLVNWNERPQDVANLLNPAFTGLLLYRATVGFSNKGDNATNDLVAR